MNDNATIIDKIAKCLNMAASSDYNEHEAMNALRIAKKLAAQHGLDLAELESERQGKSEQQVQYDIQQARVKAKRAYMKYEQYLFLVCGELFETKFAQYLTNNGSFREAIGVFIGTPTDIQLSVSVYYILKRMVERLSRKNYGLKWNCLHRSYAEGFAVRLYHRAKEQIEMDTVQESDRYALVVVNKESQVESYMEENFDGKSRHKKSSRVNGAAYMSGMAAAEDVNLDFKNGVE